ncbi:MAG: hypothetical protein IPM34_05780 [Saprospiraceae bacterium]|nr:hypothetical protein [Saprospiraceae bacterium]
MKQYILANVRNGCGFMIKLGNFKFSFLLVLTLLNCPDALIADPFDSVFKIPHPDRIRMLDHTYHIFFKDKAESERLSGLEKLMLRAKELDDDASLILLDAHLTARVLAQDSANQAKYLRRLRDLVIRSHAMNHVVLEIHLLTILADNNREAGRSGSAFTYFFRLNELIKQIPDNLLPRGRNGMVYDLARSLYTIGDDQRARNFMESNTLLNEQTHSSMMLCDLLSQVCWRTDDYACSRTYILKGMKIYELSDTNNWFFNGWRGIFWGNWAKILWSEKKYQMAIPELRAAIEVVREANLQDNVSTFGLILTDCYVRTNQIELANALLQKIKNDILQKGTTRDKIDLYKLLLTVKNSSTTVQQSLLWMDSLDHQKTLLFNEIQLNQQARKEFEQELTDYMLSEKSMSDKIRNQILLRNSLLTIVCVLFVVGSSLVFVKHQQVRKEKVRAEAIRIQGEMELQSARQELDKFKAMLIQRNRELEQALLHQTNESDHSILESMKNTTILTEDGWNSFKGIFDKVYVGYRKRLKDQIPVLTPAEERYLSLVKLELNVKEIAATLGVGTGAIRTLKSRLIQKIKLPDGIDIEKFLQTF